MNVAVVVLAAALTADFSQEICPVRPEIHSSGFGPTICSQTEQDLADLKSMGFKYARTHDWALINANQRVCDYFHIFPLMHLDAKDPRNYVFGPTDYLLKHTREEMGAEVFFRLGTSIEHSGQKVHFNSLIPEDFDKVAEIFAATVRHYNRGWAGGHNWNIKYWEIWNEPEGIMNMWAPPEGAAGKDGNWMSDQRSACRAKFVKFYVTVLKRLKEEFGDDIKVGGPALCGYNAVWLNDLLGACRDANVAPDFISWHGYARDPMQFNREAEMARKLCDSYGFPKCELILNEWHYILTWDGIHGNNSTPEAVKKAHQGPSGHNNIDSACFTLASLVKFQSSKLDQAYYYGCGPSGNWGYLDGYRQPNKNWYACRMFGDLVKNYSAMYATSAGPATASALALKSKDGKKAALLVVDYRGKEQTLTVDVKGLDGAKNVSAIMLDYTHNATPFSADWRNGTLTLAKPDKNSAAFLVTFDL